MSENLRFRGERGVSIAVVSLMLLPLLAISALAVDLGGWYAKAAQVQRAADAAALAGVTYLPEGLTPATNVARDVAARNGFKHGEGGAVVNVTRVLGATNQLTVQIIQDDVEQAFSSLFRDDVSITRQATAEYVQPVPLGSPRNYLGTGDLLDSSIRELFWLGVTGPCGSKEQGDRIATVSDANWTTNNNPPSGSNSFGGCSPGSPSYVVSNLEHDPDGYFYAVEAPPGYSGSLGIEIYDAPFCREGTNGAPENTAGAPRDRGGSTNNYPTTIRVRNGDHIDPRETSVRRTHSLGSGSTASGGGGSGSSGSSVCGTLQTGSVSVSNSRPYGGRCSGSSNWARCWRTLDTITIGGDSPRLYYVQIDPGTTGGSYQGTNQFALRLTTNGSFTACSGDPTSLTPPHNPNCPRVYGVTHMGVDASLPGTSGQTFEFYLAEIARDHRGKTLQIDLWDAGEGAQRIEILNPRREIVDFNWWVLCQDGTFPASGSCSGETAPRGGYGPFVAVDHIDVSGDDDPQPGRHRLSGSKYNDRTLRLQIPIGDYDASTWWRIRYTVGDTSTDRTTWSASVLGDPVRLVK